jgi:KaiC/GvpD/RAD55 family RecA-like ATPase
MAAGPPPLPHGPTPEDEARARRLKTAEEWDKCWDPPSGPEKPGLPETGSRTWEPIDLRAVAGQDLTASQPTMLARSDGLRLLYPGKMHAFNGPSEGGKTWLALFTCVERIRHDEHVLYIDFEDGPETFIERLMALGLHLDTIAEQFHYIRPDDPFGEMDRLRLAELLEEFAPTLAFIDGVTEAMTLHGLELNSNRDVASFIALLPRRLARSGAAVVQIDHVVKDHEQRGRHAIGAQHKLSGIDVAYAIEVVKPFGRGLDGVASITVTKDRPGHVRPHCLIAKTPGHRLVGQMKVISEGGRIGIAIEPGEPEVTATFRPTFLMEKVSRALEPVDGGLSKNGIENLVGGKRAFVRLAVRLLGDEGYIIVKPYRSSHVLISVKRYRQADDPAAELQEMTDED